MTNQKILLAVDAAGDVRILATDCPVTTHYLDDLSTDAIEHGIVSRNTDAGPGLVLWEGAVVMEDRRGYEDLYPDMVPDYRGTVRPVVSMTEALELFRMSPPDPPEYDDREVTP